MPVTASSPAPYAPTKAILEVVTRYRAKGLPQPINEDVLSRVGISESLVPRTLQSLQTLDLIDEKGAVTTTLESLKLAPEAEFKERIVQWLNAAYADVLKFIDPHTADDMALKDAFRIYNPPGQRDRMVTLFVGLYAAAGVGLEKTKTRSRTRSKSTSPAAPSRRQNGKSTSDQPKPSPIIEPEGDMPVNKTTPDGAQQHTADIKSFERELLAKFPQLDPAWGEDIKGKWFEAFEKLMAIAISKA
jgi:hypothetical protein